MRRVGLGLAATGLLAMTALTAAPAFSAPKVVATIKPVHSLVAAVMGGLGAPTLLVEGQASPHGFALKPSGARAVAEADVLFRVSATLEPFTRKIADALPKTTLLVTLDEASGVRLLVRRLGATFEPHDHGGRDHDHGDHDSAHDGHIWLDPGNAKAIVDAIAVALGQRDPDHAAQFKSNAEALKARLDALDAELARDLKPLAGKPFVVFHDSTQYFEHRFGLTAAGSITLSPEVSPSARRLSQVRQRIAKLGAVCVLADPQSPARLVATVTEGTRARSAVLDTEGALLEPPGPDLYFTLMRKLAAALKGCLDG